jgi:hypothetical protein
MALPRWPHLALLAGLAVGCATAPRQLPAAAKPAAAHPLPAGVKVQSIAEIPDVAPAAWAFVTTDLHQLGQPELVLMVKRLPGETTFPADATEIVDSLAGAVKKGRHFKEWELAGIKEGMLGRADLTGIVLAGPVPDSRVEVSGPNMNVLLITQDELEVAFHFGAPRVTNLLGQRERFFPYPPWVDRRRPSVCTPDQMKSSPMAKVAQRAWIEGGSAWQEQQEPQRVVLRLTLPAAQHVAKVLRGTEDNRLAFFPLPPGDADARLVYTPLGHRPAAISNSKTGMATRLAGVFIVLAASDDAAGAMVTEDGFSVFVPSSRWAEALTALETGHGFQVSPDKSSLPFAIEIAESAP